MARSAPAEFREMAGKLRMAHNAEQQKQAAAKGNPLLAAASHLDTQLTKRGFATARGAVDANRVKQSAAQASFDPGLATALLSLHALTNGLTQDQLAAVA